MSSIHDTIRDYLEPVVEELAGTVLQFNFSPEAPDSISFVTRFSDQVIRKYINGDAEKEYGFALVIVKQYSTEDDDINVEAMAFADRFTDWIRQQDKAKDYPNLGNNIEVRSIESLQNMANLAAINEEEGLARYQLQGRIVYIEHSEW